MGEPLLKLQAEPDGTVWLHITPQVGPKGMVNLTLAVKSPMVLSAIQNAWVEQEGLGAYQPKIVPQ